MRKLAYLVLSAMFSVAAASAGNGGTLDDVKAAGEVKCGINTAVAALVVGPQNSQY